jgi:hypothetical protein
MILIKISNSPLPVLKGVLGVLLFSATACTHESLAPPSLDPDYISSPCSPDSAYFVRDVLPILTSNCAMSGCHDAVTRAEGIRLDHYKAVIQTGEVRAGDPEHSELLEVCLETRPDKRMPPPPRSPLSPLQIETLRRWIVQGARNNDCTDL